MLSPQLLLYHSFTSLTTTLPAASTTTTNATRGLPLRLRLPPPPPPPPPELSESLNPLISLLTTYLLT
ncbi:hypothetical protein EAF00_001312 [Botryotinia globosa]|nr:hypothetical protein EAF00_001312 [Botryotinia globosa]